MAPHSSTLAWQIPFTEDPGSLQSMRSLRVRHNWATSLLTFHFHALEKEMATQSSILAWRIPGTGEPGGLLSMRSHRVGHDWSDLAAALTALSTTLGDPSYTMRWNVKHLIHGHSTTDRNHYSKSCCSHLLLFEKIFKFFESTFASMISLGTQDPNQNFRGTCYYSHLREACGRLLHTSLCYCDWSQNMGLALCCFLRLDIIVCVLSRSVVSNSLQPHELEPARLLNPWGFARQEYWSGSPCHLPFISVSILAVPVKTGAKISKRDSEA